MSDPRTQAAAMMAAARSLLRVALALVQSRRPVDLAGLQETVGRLCAAVLDLPREQGRLLRPELAALLADLDALEHALAAAWAGGPEP